LAAHAQSAAALAGVGDALNILGRASEAHHAFERLLVLDPGNAIGHYGIGSAMAQLGHHAQARSSFEYAIALAPKHATYHRALAETEPFIENDSRLTALEMLAREEQNLADDQKIELHFALAKAYDDLKRYSAAFEHLQIGNTLKRRLVAYDEAALGEFFREISSAFTPQVMRRETGYPSAVPIFIVGMPRSGTSLVEQILASDPSVFGAGELTTMQALIAKGFAGGSYPRDIAGLPDEVLHRFGLEYVRSLGTPVAGVTHVVDKLPANFRHIGLIRLALPNARIIHLRRDPLDTCLSCYSKLFLNGLNYTYDLGELGRYYRLYDGLMAHWRAVLPAGAMLEVQYETLICDFENQARRIVEYCGLGWNDRFLSFHDADRPVRTHSQAQVRQPLFTSSIGRWRRYEAFLQPLREALNQPV
jgi:tetratricopeptide (TPR) repeat protein